MGPCELMDLIGHDTNFAVTSSVYEANFFDKRFQPSLVQREMVDGGLLGRKNGQGFYRYDAAGKPIADAAPADAAPADAQAPAALAQGQTVVLHGQGAVSDRLAAALARAGIEVCRDSGQGGSHGSSVHAAEDWTGLAIGRAQLRLSDGRSAAQLAAERAALPDQSGDIAIFDLPLGDTPGAALAWTAAPQAGEAWLQAAPQWLAALGFVPQRVADVPGLVVARTIAMLINEAADAVQQGVCTPEGADAAMKLGVNYPAGPFEWLGRWDTRAVVSLLDALDGHYRGERYRASPWLRQRAWAA
jgi:3-hydroxybutyryl-CoA dehydrogenase